MLDHFKRAISFGREIDPDLTPADLRGLCAVVKNTISEAQRRQNLKSSDRLGERTDPIDSLAPFDRCTASRTTSRLVKRTQFEHQIFPMKRDPP